MDKSHIVQVLRDMSLLLQMKGENPFKSRAYDVAADRLAGLAEPLETVVAEGRLQELPGIGQALAETISELSTTGNSKAYEELKQAFPPKILELLDVEALGPKKAAALFHELGIGDLDGLAAACRKGQVSALKGFGKKTEEKILAGVELLKKNKSLGRIPLGKAIPIAEDILARIRKAQGVQRAEVAGSVRRFCETVGDIDILCTTDAPEPVFESLVSHPEVEAVLGRGTTKCSVRLTSGLQVDVRVLPQEDFATALHHFTGSKAHHIRLRSLAQARGMTLSEWGVFRGEEKLPVPDEESLYALLDMQFVPPEMREDQGEIEQALSKTLPSSLVSLKDVRGNLHCHSTWSDGNSSIEDLAAEAQRLGFSYLTLTEHSQTAGYARGLKEEALKRQWEEIENLKPKFPHLVLLRGIESDILPDGSLDYPDSLLQQFDVVIGSIHARHGMNTDEMTERILKAFDNPYFHIWGHPTGRLILERDPAPMHMEVLLDKAATRHIAVEVNGSPDRLDLKADHIRMALNRKVRLVVSSDAHHKDHLGPNLRFAVHTARKAGAQPQDILNCLPAPSFLNSLRPKA